MPDPLQTLPNELWGLCMEFAIAGRVAGPLELIMVSQPWGSALLDSPALWTQIYIQNGEDEMARISTFLHLSRQSPLHVDVMTVLPNVDGLRLVSKHISRVRTISIRPGASDNFTALRAEQWKRAAAYTLENLSNGMKLPEAGSPTCFGVTLWDDVQWYYHVILMQFTVAAREAGINEPNYKWSDHITNERIIPDPEEEDQAARVASISSIAALASQDRFYDVIRIAIPALIEFLQVEEDEVQVKTFHLIEKLASLEVDFREAIASSIPLLVKRLEHENASVRSAVAELIGKLVNYAEFREAIASTSLSFIQLLQDEDHSVHSKVFQVIGELADHVEFREAVVETIPFLNELLDDRDEDTRWKTVELIGNLANHAEFSETITSMWL